MNSRHVRHETVRLVCSKVFYMSSCLRSILVLILKIYSFKTFVFEKYYSCNVAVVTLHICMGLTLYYIEGFKKL